MKQKTTFNCFMPSSMPLEGILRCRAKGSKALVNALRCLFSARHVKKIYRCLSEVDRLMLGCAHPLLVLRFLNRLAMDVDGRAISGLRSIT